MSKPCGWDIQAKLGDCQYCEAHNVPVVPDPFGHVEACLECFTLIIGGPDDP